MLSSHRRILASWGLSVVRADLNSWSSRVARCSNLPVFGSGDLPVTSALAAGIVPPLSAFGRQETDPAQKILESSI
jgi:hypothetical protein